MPKRNLHFLLVGLFVLGGCAVHAPISETLIFHSPNTKPSYHRRTGFGIVGTAAPAPGAVIEQANVQFPDVARHPDSQMNPHRFSGALYLADYDRGQDAFSITVGIAALGVDYTQHLWRRKYLTIADSAPGQIQVYLQHRATAPALEQPSASAIATTPTRSIDLTFITSGFTPLVFGQ